MAFEDICKKIEEMVVSRRLTKCIIYFKKQTLKWYLKRYEMHSNIFPDKSTFGKPIY